MSTQKFRFEERFSPPALYIDSIIPLEQIIHFIVENKIESIIINSENGFTSNTIAPFCQLKQLKFLGIVLYYEDISCIQQMSQLEELHITHSDPLQLDLSVFKNLKALSYEWSKHISGLAHQKKLKVLSISKYKSSEADLSKLISLEELQLFEGNLKSLDFLKECIDLKKLELAYLPKLSNVSALASVCNSLEILDIDSCKNVDWQEELSSLKNLQKLMLRGVEIESIEWVKNMHKLQHLSIIDSNIISGDIKPAEGIKFVKIDNRHHYNYKFDDSTMKIVPKA